MKKCPVCGGMSFDDALTCFGCMHRFDTAVDAHLATDPAEPPARAELPVRAEPSVVELVRAPSSPEQAPKERVVEAKAWYPVVQAGAQRMSGRATLRRRGAPTTATERSAIQAEVQRIELPGNTARYELVVSLQPVG